MSVDVIQPSSMLPMKRARETIDLSDDSVSKCGELFVTNCANKWTFYCTYCQKATTDIGVFICHIRLEHLNDQQSPQTAALKSNVSTTIASSLQNELNLARFSNSTSIECSLTSQELATNIEQQPVASYIVKEEPTVNLSQHSAVNGAICTTDSKILDMSNQTGNAIADEVTIAAVKTADLTGEIQTNTENSTINTTNIPGSFNNSNANINKDDGLNDCDSDLEFIDEWHNDNLTSGISSASNAPQTITTPKQGNKCKNLPEGLLPGVTIAPVKTEDITGEIQTNTEDITNINANMPDSYNNSNANITDDDSLNDCGSDLEFIDDNVPSGSSRNKKLKKSISASEDNSVSTFKCPFCIAEFRNKNSLAKHIFHFHDKQLPIRCKKCQRGFLTANSLKVHLRYHEENNHFQCPVCKTKHMENYFIAHVLSHESATCFPCQVCGKLYASQEERTTHWNTHAQEKPFACNICYRRYKENQYLTRHLKTHIQYNCNFCPAKFNAIENQRPPYVCAICEKLPDIKQRVEYLKSLNDSNPIFDSDEDTIGTLNSVGDKNDDNNSEAMSSNVPTGDVSDGTESHKQYECSLCSSVYNTPETQRSPYVCEKCKNLPESLLPELTIAALKTEDLSGEIQTNTEDITNINANMPDSYNNSNANITDDESLNDWDSDLEFIDDNVTSGSSRNKKMKKSISASEDISLENFKCPYCNKEFSSKSGLTRHIYKFHDKQLSIRCEKCQKGFITAKSLKQHRIFHDENHTQCPVCKAKNLGTLFIKHILTHESATCFPCQVCGNVYASQEERMTHWKTHAYKKPFACNICYRRYAKIQNLTLHLRIHKQYLCNFCPAKFNATAYQRPPYVCAKCEKFTDIKQRVEYFKSLNDNNPISDSDENTIGTLNPIEGLDFKHGEQLPSSKNQDTAAIIELIPKSGSTYNSDSNTRSSYAANDKIFNDDDDRSNKDGSDLKDDTLTTSRTPLAYKCKYCKRDCKSKPGLVLHLRKSLQCQRVFQSKSALNHHTEFPDKNSQFK